MLFYFILLRCKDIMQRLSDGFKGEKAILIPNNVRNFQVANPVTCQMFITEIGYYPRAKYHYFERPAGFNENILIYCCDGTGCIKYNDTVHSLNRNQLFIIPANYEHAYWADLHSPWTIYWFHFCGENVSMFSSIIGKIIHIEESDKSRCDDRLKLFEEMFQNLEMGYSTENMEYVSFCLIHFLASLKYSNQFHEISKAKKTDVIQKSILFMKENLEHKITLKDIAHHVNYSTSHFSAFFAQKTSYAPMEYYNKMKIQRACSYLQFSDMQVQEIAFLLGFYDPFHFSNAFKQEMEVTPKEYRNNVRKNVMIGNE